MEKLDFVLPDFHRVSWVSDSARAAWEPKIDRVVQAWLEIEWLSIQAGLRVCAVTMFSPEDLVARSARWLDAGLIGLPIESHADPAGHRVLRVLVGTLDDVSAFRQAMDRADDQAIARRLGTPACCHAFYRQVWVEQGLEDTTWPMAQGTRNTAVSAGEADSITVEGPIEANILWRWLGVRAVPHLPCGFGCEPTAEIGSRCMELGREAGYDDEMDWLSEILSWPVEWSALHGIALVKTPVLTISTRTDATAGKYQVRWPGLRYPEAGAQGLGFPYRQPGRPLLTQTRRYTRGLEHPIESEGR